MKITHLQLLPVFVSDDDTMSDEAVSVGFIIELKVSPGQLLTMVMVEERHSTELCSGQAVETTGVTQESDVVTVSTTVVASHAVLSVTGSVHESEIATVSTTVVASHAVLSMIDSVHEPEAFTVSTTVVASHAILSVADSMQETEAVTVSTTVVVSHAILSVTDSVHESKFATVSTMVVASHAVLSATDSMQESEAVTVSTTVVRFTRHTVSYCVKTRNRSCYYFNNSCRNSHRGNNDYIFFRNLMLTVVAIVTFTALAVVGVVKVDTSSIVADTRCAVILT